MDGGEIAVVSMSGTGSLHGPAVSTPPGRSAPRSRRGTVNEARIATVTEYDPITGLEVFRSHWKMALNLMERGDFRRYTLDEAKTVVNHVRQMTHLLCEESMGAEKDLTRPLLDFFLKEEVLSRFVIWAGEVTEFWDDLKLEQLKIYEILLASESSSILSRPSKHLLSNEPILNPLLSLLGSCAECHSKQVENALIELLHLLCISISSNPSLLEVVFSVTNRKSINGVDKNTTDLESKSSSESSQLLPSLNSSIAISREFVNESFLIFSLLIPYTHKEGHLGQTARDALLLIMSLSSRHPHIGRFIASEEHSNFCIVLATGLSGLYSSLPRKLSPIIGASPDQWCHLTKEDAAQIPDLLQFLNSLEFCNAVTQAAHPAVKAKLLDFVYNGFLVPVIGPALHQNSLEEVATATAYLDLFLRTITEPSLLSTFLRFILTEKHDEIVILDSLITRINSNSKLCAVSLSLFKTLVDLNREDVMLQLVLKYLLPLDHVMASQRSRAAASGKGALPEIETYLQAAPEKFLSMIPACCVVDEESHNLTMEFSRFDNISSIQPYSGAYSGAGYRTSRRGSFSSLASTESFAGSTQPQKIPPELSYLQYLHDARKCVAECAAASNYWSSSYDESAILSRGPPASDDAKKIINIAPLPPRTDDFTIPEFSIQRLATTQDTNSDDENVGTPDKKRKKAPPSDSGFEGVTVETSGSTSAAISPCESSGSVEPVENERDETNLSRFSPIPSVLERAATPSNICDIAIEETIAELECLIAGIEEWRQQNEACIPTESCLKRVNPDKEESKTVIAEQEDPLSQFAGPASEGASEALEKITRNSSVNDPHSMEPNIVEVKSVVEPLKPSRTSSHLFHDSSVSSSASLHDMVTTEKERNAAFGNTIGPFLQGLLLKLEGMLHNSYSVNLLLTGLIIRLAAYPQPIIRSFLLHPNLVFQPNVKSLFQVLHTLKQRLDHFSYSVDNFEDLLVKSKRYLRIRELESGCDSSLNQYSIIPDSVSATPHSQKRPPEKESSRFRILADLFRSASSKKVDKEKKRSQIQLRIQQRRLQERAEVTQDGRGYRYFAKSIPVSATQSLDDDPIFNEMTRSEAIKLKNAVFSAVVLEEFLKELAATAQEQALFMMELKH